MTTAFSLLFNYMDGFEPPITEGSENFCLASTNTNIPDCVQTVYALWFLANNTAVKHFYVNPSFAKFWLDIYRWRAGMAVAGRIRDIGLNT